MPLIHGMDQVIEQEGTDYSHYSSESKKLIASAASLAVSVKAVLDTPLLTEAGSLTEQSAAIADETQARIQKFEHK